MTTPTHGADVPALRLSAQAMCDAAEALIATDLRVSGALSSLTWNGPDAMRARQAWDTEHGPALFAAAGELARAGSHLLAEAEDQEHASTADGGPAGPPPGAIAASIRASLGAELFAIRTVMDALTPSSETIERIRGAVTWANLGLNVNTVIDKLPTPTRIAGPVAAAGLVSDVTAFRTARAEGDLDGQLRSGGSVVGSVVGLGSPKHGAVISATWEGAWQFRDRFFTGSRWEENYIERNDAIADMIGPLSVPVGLGTFIVSGAETAWETVTEDEDDPSSGGGVGGR